MIEATTFFDFLAIAALLIVALGGVAILFLMYLFWLISREMRPVKEWQQLVDWGKRVNKCRNRFLYDIDDEFDADKGQLDADYDADKAVMGFEKVDKKPVKHGYANVADYSAWNK